jgi:hypothetical protein
VSRAGTHGRRTIEELKDGISKAIDRLRALPEPVCGFFTDPDLAYIQETSTFPLVASVDEMAVATRRRMP